MASLRGGIDLGGTKIQAVIVDDDNQPKGDARRPTPTEGGPQDVADAMIEAFEEAAKAAGVEAAELSGIGAGSPGDVDQEKGVVSRAGNLPGWAGSFPLADALHERLKAPVKIGNDVAVATWAEYKLGAAKPFSSVLGVFWGTGVGGGLILDNVAWHGRGGAGEIGHTVVKRHGAKCPCGRRGCLEAYAGRRAMEEEAHRRVDEDGEKTKLFKLMEKKGRPRLTSGIFAEGLEHHDEMTHALMDRAVEALGTAIASAQNLLDLEAVIIGGGMGIRFGPEYRDAIAREMHEHLFNNASPPALEVASLGDLGGAIGAALLVV